jgi:hypothetical protein
MRTDGRTDRHDEANGRFSQFCQGASKHAQRKTKLRLSIEEVSDLILRAMNRIIRHYQYKTTQKNTERDPNFCKEIAVLNLYRPNVLFEDPLPTAQ